jgi:hypothetical protein
MTASRRRCSGSSSSADKACSSCGRSGRCECRASKADVRQQSHVWLDSTYTHTRTYVPLLPSALCDTNISIQSVVRARLDWGGWLGAKAGSRHEQQSNITVCSIHASSGIGLDQNSISNSPTASSPTRPLHGPAIETPVLRQSSRRLGQPGRALGRCLPRSWTGLDDPWSWEMSRIAAWMARCLGSHSQLHGAHPEATPGHAPWQPHRPMVQR